MLPLVSVVLPVHNGGDYLAEAVRSILGQTHKNLELLLVDDHSTDAAIAGLGITDPRLRVLSSGRTGVANAFNTGFDASRGAFVARMDADDVAAPGRIERQLDLLHADAGLGIVGTRVEIFSSQGVGEGNRVYRDWLNSLVSPESIHKAMYIESPIPNPTAMFRRQVLQRLGGYRDPDWPEDYDLFLRADAAGIRMAKPAEVLLRWRDHAGRLTRTDPRYRPEAFLALKVEHLVHGPLHHERRPVWIWGAGRYGRLLCRALEAAGAGERVQAFVDIDPEKIGRQRRGRPVHHRAELRKNPGVAVLAGGFEDDADGAVAELLQFVVEEAHTAGGLHEAILDDELAVAGHSPAGQVSSVEQLLRVRIGLGTGGGAAGQQESREEKRRAEDSLHHPDIVPGFRSMPP